MESVKIDVGSLEDVSVVNFQISEKLTGKNKELEAGRSQITFGFLLNINLSIS